MKKLAILLLLSCVVLVSYSNDNESSKTIRESNTEEKAGIDHPIVGKWEYVKTILPDGREVINLIATEHFYSNGTLLFVNVWLNPQPVNEFSNTPEGIESNLRSAIGAIGTYTIEKGKEKDKLTYNIVNSTRMKDMGKSNSIDIKVHKDTFIYYMDNGNQLIMKKVKDN
jgi:hypothetical protein